MKEVHYKLNTILDFLIDKNKNIPVTDFIFIFGNVDPRIPRHAAKLFKEKMAPKIIISGGIGSLGKDPNGFKSEAEYYKSILIDNGVSEEFIILENEATNTLENVLFGIKKAKIKNLEINSLILVSMPALLKRSKATFLKHFPEIEIYGDSFLYNEDEIKDERRARRFLAEIDRLKEYGEKGDISKTKIPKEVRKAYDSIKKELEII